jgi:hydroxymethylbilane synthase
MKVKIGTRGSKLALAQSSWVKSRIEDRYPQARVELVTIQTTGDKILDASLSRIGGKGLFVKEIEEALLRKQIDLAVHSMKDVPAELPEGLALTVFPEREDPRDGLVSKAAGALEHLPAEARVGTGSLRRMAQLRCLRPDLQIVSVRGNVDTRLKKLETGELDAVVLATAGLRRLGLAERITQILPPTMVLPAIGQGALGLEVRQGDERISDILDFMNHEETQITVKAERAFLKELGGGCQVPIAALGRLEGRTVHLAGLVAEIDGSVIFRDAIAGSKENPEQIGFTLASRLLKRGAKGVLERIYGNL